jgi:hypothetical protein
MRRGACVLRVLAAAAAMVAAVATTPADAAAPEAPASGESVAASLDLAARWAGLLRDSVSVLTSRPDPPTLNAAVADARNMIAEIDRLAANAAIYQAAPTDRQKLLDLAAQAHLNVALFETHALEFDRARQEISRARALSDLVQSDSFRTEWAAMPAGEPGKALQTRFNLLTLSEFEAALGSIWARARVVPLEFRGFTSQELAQVRLSAAAAPPPGSVDERLILRGTAAARDAFERGQASLSVPLPPGVYRLEGRPGGDIARSFVVPEASDVDAVVVDRARFALRFEPKPGPHPPRFFLNGIEMADLAALPYGVYRVKGEEGDYPGAPQVIRFVLGEGIPDKTRTSWTVYVPAGMPAVLAFDRNATPQRRRLTP